MRTLFLIALLICFYSSRCNSQNSVFTNEIFQSNLNLKGIKSKRGKILVKPIYADIQIIYSNQRKTYQNIQTSEVKPLQFYIVTSPSNEKAILNNNGNEILGLMKCSNLQLDEKTKTIVVECLSSKNNTVSTLYNLEGQQVDTTSYNRIGYVENSDIIMLEKQKRKEIYLFNMNKKLKLGPFDHFVVLDENYDSTLGIKELKFTKLTEPLGILTRYEQKWGLITIEGDEILPMKYSSITLLTEDHKNHPFFKLAKKPSEVEFILSANLQEDNMRKFYFDKKYNKYEMVNEEKPNSSIGDRIIIKVSE